MSRNSSGTYSLPVGNPVVSGTIITSTWANDTMNDIATALTDSLSRSGKGGMTAGLKLFDGTVSAPGMTFDSETTTGFYRAGTNDVRFSLNAVELMKLTAGSLALSSSTTLYPQNSVKNTTADANAGYYIFDKSRNGAIIQSGDILGSTQWRGFDGTNFIPAASIVGYVGGTPGTNDMPGALGFFTTADGAATPTRRVYIDAAGDMTLDHLPSNVTSELPNVYVDANGKLYKGTQASPSSSKSWTYFTSSGTYTVPTGVSSIRGYAGGAGGNGGTASSVNGAAAGGGGGGFAFGDIAVTPGQSVVITISGGAATLAIGGTNYLIATGGTSASAGTPGSGGAGSKHASVTNGGAYSGGAGGSGTAGSGGGSCGSPLGNGYAGGTLGGGGGGIGGIGANGSGAAAGGGGGGAGGAGGTVGGGGFGSAGGSAGGAASGGYGGQARTFTARFTDPLLTDAVNGSPSIPSSTAGYGSPSPSGSGGSGATFNNPAVVSPAFTGGNFGGGGGMYTASGTSTAAAGGLMGGGGGAANNNNTTATSIGGNGGLGGGGGGATAITTRTAGTGGGAFVFIYA